MSFTMVDTSVELTYWS